MISSSSFKKNVDFPAEIQQVSLEHHPHQKEQRPKALACFKYAFQNDILEHKTFFILSRKSFYHVAMLREEELRCAPLKGAGVPRVYTSVF